MSAKMIKAVCAVGPCLLLAATGAEAQTLGQSAPSGASQYDFVQGCIAGYEANGVPFKTPTKPAGKTAAATTVAKTTAATSDASTSGPTTASQTAKAKAAVVAAKKGAKPWKAWVRPLS